MSNVLKTINGIECMPIIKGVELATYAAKETYQNRDDLLLVVLEDNTSVAGVFTQSSITCHNIEWCKSIIGNGKAKALIVNAGNANCFNGEQGRKANLKIVEAVAKQLGCKKEEVFSCATGVIGEKINVNNILDSISSICNNLAEDNWINAAKAIMTTDTYYKISTRFSHIGGVPISISGIAKGSGMIAPNMATTLGFIFTDANIPPHVLQDLLKRATKKSFNAITVDGDTSTNDTVLAFATGKSNSHSEVTSYKDSVLKDFARAFEDVMVELSKLVVVDGEGAKKVIEVTVLNAENAKAARNIAMSIGNSPLVKTAIGGEDPNWGRILMAVGKVGEKIDIKKISLKICGYDVVKDGEIFSAYNPEQVHQALASNEVTIEVDVASGKKSATIWGCDLTSGYIDINNDYKGSQKR